MDWEDHRVFLAVLRRHGFAAAARPLGMAPATVRRHVETLEARLGIPLFLRNPEGLIPTAAALELGPIAEKMEGAVGAFDRAASGARDEVRGLVKVVCGEALGLKVLMPIFAQIRRAHPGVRFTLAIDGGVSPLLRGAADVAVTLTPPRPENLVVRPVGKMAVGLFAHRRYLERFGCPQAMADLSRHALIGTDDEQLAARVEADMGLDVGAECFVVVADSIMGQVSAIQAELGIGFCLTAMVADDPDIIRVLPEVSALDLDVTVASRADQEHMVRTVIVRDSIADALTARFFASPSEQPAATSIAA